MRRVDVGVSSHFSLVLFPSCLKASLRFSEGIRFSLSRYWFRSMKNRLLLIPRKIGTHTILFEISGFGSVPIFLLRHGLVDNDGPS